MPGPQAKNRTKRPDSGSTDRKARHRIEARRATVPNSGQYPTGAKSSYFHKPGSENRKK